MGTNGSQGNSGKAGWWFDPNGLGGLRLCCLDFMFSHAWRGS
jgi:hypothetical protein